MNTNELTSQLKQAFCPAGSSCQLENALLHGLLSGGGLLIEHLGRIPIRRPIKAFGKALAAQDGGGSGFSTFRCLPEMKINDLIESCTQPFPEGGPDTRILPALLLLEDVGQMPSSLVSFIESLLNEEAVTHGETTVKRPPIFLLIGEQNRSNREAESRLHNFLAPAFGTRITLEAPGKTEELRLLKEGNSRNESQQSPELAKLLSAARTALRDEVELPENLYEEAVHFSNRLADDDRVALGGSPTVAMLSQWLNAAKVNAFLKNQQQASWDDLKEVLEPSLGHRIHRESRTIDKTTQIFEELLGEQLRVAPSLAATDTPEEATSTGPLSLEEAYTQIFAPMRKWLDEKVIGRGDDGEEGQVSTLDLVFVTLFSGGHLLLEDFPGSGKSYMSKLLGGMIDDDRIEEPIDIVSYNRIQCTPDLLPSDATGYMTLDNGQMRFRRGPIFAYILLVDEINRTTPKVQSSLLQAMGERQISIDDRTYDLSELFFVIATQNPLDRVGTYELPQAQLDRFLFKRQLPPMTNREHLRKIMRIKPGNDEHKSTMPKIGATRIIAASKAIFGRQPDNSDNIRIPPEVEEVILNIPTVIGKRCEPSYQNKDRMKQGSQPSIRTLQRFVPALKTLAWVESKGRAPQVKVDHVRKLCCDLLRHRILPIEPLDNEETDACIQAIVQEAIEMATKP